MSKNSSRASNFELLRILAMLMIISYHIIIHCVNVQLVNTDSIERLQNGWFNQPLFFRQLLGVSLMMPFGLVGNSLFIMISGYFLAEKEIDIFKTSKKLLLQLLFAAIVLVGASAYFIYKAQYSLHSDTLFSYIRIQYFNKMSWFVGYYFIIIFIAYLGLNKFLSSLDSKKYLGFLLAILTLSQLGWSGSLLDDLAKGLRTVVVGIFLFALGGYIKRFNPFDRIRAYVFFVIIILTNVLIGISYYNTANGKIQAYYYGITDTTVEPAEFVQYMPKYENYSIVVIILGVCIFELFRRLPMPSIKVINWIAAPTFMIYLLHDNGFAYSIWETNDWVTLLYYDFSGFAVKLFTWALAIFTVGFVAYYIYFALVKLIIKGKWLFIKSE
ncbi:Acyltransferase family protein [Pseudobutyrivibrio sp. OR37]|uniref:acyltransferase family protein n=1 Tax=Pseudobutyrivibrio sp. OR37 TaxID=1798186 RepID=UPI0008E439D5|nr:acyltransferase family protein [Pseudobutyrivibrio sp. OR37]SFH87959.1 Acyltransferase family protein [Pseudobutyrivibrio sp. OR37]